MYPWCICACVCASVEGEGKGERERVGRKGRKSEVHNPCTCHCYHSRYFTEDLPVLLFTSLPLTVLGVWQCPSHWSRAPFWLALWELIVHSVLSHKEHRYVLPIVPIASIYAGTHIRDCMLSCKLSVQEVTWFCFE